MSSNNKLKSNRQVCEQELIEIIGIAATLQLEQAYSASYLYIPARAPSKGIIDAIGIVSALALVKHFGCSDIWVPKTLLTKHRNTCICQDKKIGKTLPELANKFKTGIPNIRRILKERGIAARLV